jgi:hypothetical protein
VSRPRHPPALPPETRPVGQLVAEAVRVYGDSFWTTLPLGLPIALVNQVSAGHRLWFQVAVLAAAAPALSAAYVGACLRIRRGPWAVPLALGTLLILPLPLLMLVYILPAVAWLALVGLAVPAGVFERRGAVASLRRGVELGRADYVHALGSLAALTIIFGVTKLALIVLLHGQADAAERTALFLADLVLSPLLFLGAALLYFDQAARVESGRPTTRRKQDADLHSSVQSDGARRSDAEVEP